MKRTKRRYLALQLEVSTVPSEREFLNAVWGALTQIFGEYGASLTNLSLISYNQEAKTAILRVNLNAVENTRASLVTITSVAGKEAAVHVLAASGTIKALKKNMENSHSL